MVGILYHACCALLQGRLHIECLGQTILMRLLMLCNPYDRWHCPVAIASEASYFDQREPSIEISRNYPQRVNVTYGRSQCVYEIMIPFATQYILKASKIGSNQLIRRPMPDLRRIEPCHETQHLLGLLLRLLVTEHGVLLGLDSLDLALTSSLGLLALGVHLLLENTLTAGLGLGAVDLYTLLGQAHRILIRY